MQIEPRSITRRRWNEMWQSQQNVLLDGEEIIAVAFDTLRLKEAIDAHTPAPATDVGALLSEAEHWLHQILGDTTRSIIQRLATALRESRAREVAEPYRHALEQRLVCSNLPLLTGDADADLMRFVFHEQEIAGYFCGQLEADLATARAELGALGPVEWCGRRQCSIRVVKEAQ